MKKVLSLTLALVLTLSLGFAAIAAEVTGTADISGQALTSEPSDASIVSQMKFRVSYVDQAGDTLAAAACPEETLSFTVSPDGKNPAVAAVTVGLGGSNTHDFKATDSNYNDIPINIPAYTVPGKYHYTIKLNSAANKTLGVTYSTAEIYLQVVVVNNTESETPAKLKTVTFSAKDLPTNTKVNSLQNTYTTTDSAASSSQFSVDKVVTGNMADKSQSFKINVVLTKENDSKIASSITVGSDKTYAPGDWIENKLTMELSLTDAMDPVVITGIPIDTAHPISYTVTEAAAHTANPGSNTPSEGYTASYTLNGTGSGENNSNPVSSTFNAVGDRKVVVTNTKELDAEAIKPNTGVYLDALPYIILLAVAAAGIVIFLIRRRSHREY